MDMFVFGTMLHVPLLRIVTGLDDVERQLVWAVRPSYRVSRAQGQACAVLHPDPQGVAEGVIVEGLGAQALERLDYYEQAFGYERAEFDVFDADQTARRVMCYLPPHGRWHPAEPWDREAWITRFGPMAELASVEAMALMGHMPAAAMGERYPQMLARAASRLRAEAEPHHGNLSRADVTVDAVRRPYTGFFAVEEVDLRFRRFDGQMSEPVERGVFLGVDCAIVLPYDPQRDRVLVVEQFRTGAYLRGDPNPWTVEPIAGRIDPGEEPEQAARREAEEEAGIALRELKCVSAAYPSPGTTTEHFFVYVGIADLPDGTAGIGGKLSEAEDIRSHVMPWAEFDRALNAGDFRLLPLVVAGHWLARNREALRASA